MIQLALESSVSSATLDGLFIGTYRWMESNNENDRIRIALYSQPANRTEMMPADGNPFLSYCRSPFEV